MRLTAIVLALTVASCATSGKKIDPSATAAIQPGKTTRAEMIEQFGTPSYQGKDASGAIVANWVYVHTGFVGIGTEAQTMYVIFDQNDVVQKVTYSGSVPGK